MSKMTHKRKCEIVEALKVNERAYCFLSDEEKEVLRLVDVLKCMQGSSPSDYPKWKTHKFPKYDSFGNHVFQVPESYTVEIEPPEGYRLVTDEERGMYDKPKCFSCASRESRPNNWLYESRNNLSVEWYEDHYYAVPLTFSFEPESMTLAEVCKELGRDIKITK